MVKLLESISLQNMTVYLGLCFSSKLARTVFRVTISPSTVAYSLERDLNIVFTSCCYPDSDRR